MARKKKNTRAALGAGLDALLGGFALPNNEEQEKELIKNFFDVPINQIEANPYQPRKEFESNALAELAKSISVHGIIQPITVRYLEGDDMYQLISGERRWRASKLAGLARVPAYIISPNSKQEIIELALIENLQREDLNPMEIAWSYQRLLDECKLKQEELAGRVGKNHSTVSNYLRLQKLPPEIKAGLKEKKISFGHARAIINVKDVELQKSIYQDILDKGLSVRAVEQIKRALTPKTRKGGQRKNAKPLYLRKIEDALSRELSTKVDINQSREGKGKIVLTFADNEDLNRLLEKLRTD